MTKVYFKIMFNGKVHHSFILIGKNDGSGECTARACCADARRKISKESGLKPEKLFCHPRNPKPWQDVIMRQAIFWDILKLGIIPARIPCNPGF